MAILYPNIETIKKMKPEPEKGEMRLLLFLLDALDDKYEIFFQPYLNGDRPDIVVVRKDTGILIIEVKDWDLTRYKVNDRGQWLLSNETQIRSPFFRLCITKRTYLFFILKNYFRRKLKTQNYLVQLPVRYIFIISANIMCNNL